MKKIAAVIIVAVTTSLLAFTPIEKTTWSLDKAHAKLGFTITHLMVSDVEGWFKTFDAKITSNKEDFSDAEVEMTADVNSVNTDNEKRDTHLKSPDFFEVTKYPLITFKSKTFKKVSDKIYKVTGDLTIHGITRPLELDVVCKVGTNPMSKKSVAGFKITGMIKRMDFGIGASMSSAMISDEVAIVANAEFIKD